MRAWVGLGSNLDDPEKQIRDAIRALAELSHSGVGSVSSLYRSDPVGLTDQPAFCNAVAAVDTALAPLALLRALQAIETAAGRRRTIRWGPRVLDLDLLLHGDRVSTTPELTLPHPRMHERAFVLVPLAELAPDLEIPDLGSVAVLAGRVRDQHVVPWDAT